MEYREKYLRRARIAGKVLRWVPFVRMAGLNGSIVRGEESEESDIDFLIIARFGRLYTARFFAACLIHLTGWRRYGAKVAGRICLNCYLGDKNPSIKPKDSKSDLKVAMAYKYLIPLVDFAGAAERFFKANKWFAKHRVSGAAYSRALREKLTPKGAARPVRFLEIYLRAHFGDWVEGKLMDFQRRRILAGKSADDETVATEKEIRLHPRKQKNSASL